MWGQSMSGNISFQKHTSGKYKDSDMVSGNIDRLQKSKKNSLDSSQSLSRAHLFHADHVRFLVLPKVGKSSWPKMKHMAEENESSDWKNQLSGWRRLIIQMKVFRIHRCLVEINESLVQGTWIIWLTKMDHLGEPIQDPQIRWLEYRKIALCFWGLREFPRYVQICVHFLFLFSNRKRPIKSELRWLGRSSKVMRLSRDISQPPKLWQSRFLDIWKNGTPHPLVLNR